MTILYEYRCPRCGMPLSAPQSEMCESCGAKFPIPTEVAKVVEDAPDPDRPAWGVGAAFGMWFFSVLLIIAAPIVSTMGWTFWQHLQGISIRRGDIKELLSNPNYVLLFIFSTFVAQIITLLGAYQVVLTSGVQDFFAALGWRWHPRFRLIHAILLTIGVTIVAVFFSNLLPNRETDLERLLKVSFTVRVFTAVIAVVSAPLVEEVIYRGLLYSALRKQIGLWPAIITVSLIFVGVHVPQYWGGWGVLASLSTLSFGLTLVRAYTGSLLPSYTIHLLFNAVNAVGIILEGILKK